MSSVHMTNPEDESSMQSGTGPIRLAAIRWILITALALATWAGAAAMARSAANEFTHFDPTMTWLISMAATLPVALGVMSTCDRLFEAPGAAKRR